MGRAERCISEITNTDYQREDCRVPAWLHSERSRGCLQAVSPPAHLYEIGVARQDVKPVDREEYWFEAVLFILI